MLERFLIGRYLGKTLVDGLGDILDNARWVVGFRVYIEWDVSWFRKGSMCAVLQIYIEEVNRVLVYFDRDSQTVFVEDGTKLLLDQICLFT